jgi:hypothetical protein
MEEKRIGALTTRPGVDERDQRLKLIECEGSEGQRRGPQGAERLVMKRKWKIGKCEWRERKAEIGCGGFWLGGGVRGER